MLPLAAALRPVRVRPLAAECLEDRCLPAGNVVATFIDGDLQVAGDRLNNAIEIRSAGADLLVRSLDTTRINGQTEVVFLGGALLLHDLRVVMGTGHDRLFVSDLLVAGDALLGRGQVDTVFDAGNDLVVLENVGVGGDLKINTGAGADRVCLDFVAVLGETELRGGAGNDQIKMIDTALVELTLDAGSGRDCVDIIDSTIGGPSNVRLGAGDDKLRILGDTIVSSGTFLQGNSGRDRLVLDDEATLLGFPLLNSLEIRQTV